MSKTDQSQEQVRADKPEIERNERGDAASQEAQAAARERVGDDASRAESAGVRSAARVENFGSGMVGGVSHIATDLVRGVGDVGEEVVIAVRDTANTAIVGVGSIGQTAIHTIADLVAGVVDGVRDIGSAGRRQGPSTTSTTETRHESRLH